MKFKHYVLFLLVVCLLSVEKTNAQTIQWDTPGTTWVYKMIAMTTNHYQVLRMIGDTTVNGQAVKKIDITEFFIEGYGSDTYTTPESYLRTEFMYEENNQVYRYQDGTFFLLYDFSADTDDSWIISGDNEYECLDGGTFPNSDVILINERTTASFSGIDIEVQHTASSQFWELGQEILSGVGSASTFLPRPTPWSCQIDFPNDIGGRYERLVCYSNNEIGQIQFNNNTFDFCYSIITSNDEVISTEFSIDVFPNPTTDIIYFKNIQNLSRVDISVHNIEGKLCFRDNDIGDSVNVENLNEGVYFISLFESGNFIKIFKVIKM